MRTVYFSNKLYRLKNRAKSKTKLTALETFCFQARIYLLERVNRRDAALCASAPQV